MPFHPNNSTAIPSNAPVAGAAAPFDPQQLVRLSGISNSFEDDTEVLIAEAEFVRAPRVPVSSSQWTVTPLRQQPTVIEITTDQPLTRPSEEEPFSPIHLQRIGFQEGPVALTTTPQAGLRDIAGSPLASTPAGLPAQRLPASEFSYAHDLLSSPSGNHPVLNHVTPEFDSTHQIMRIPPRHETLLPPELPGVSSMQGNLPQMPRTPETEEFQADIALPRYMPALSWTVGVAGMEHPPLTGTTTPAQSAPPALERLPPVQQAPVEDDNAYQQALQNESVHVVLLKVGLGRLDDSAPPGLEAAPQRTYTFDALAAYQLRSRQLPPVEAADSETDSDDEAVEIVGSPDPFAM